MADNNLETSLISGENFNLLKEIVDAKYAEAATGDMAPYEKISKFCADLATKYGKEEVAKRRLFRLLARDNVLNSDDCPYYDFAGDDSIEKFILGL